MSIDKDPPACSHIQGDVTAERQPFVVGVVLESCGLGRGHHGERDVYILSTVDTENTYTPARWLALERACHQLRSLVVVSVSFTHCSSSRLGRVFVSSSRFVLRLATAQAVCNLARVVLELHRLDEICVPLEVSLST